MKRPRLSYANVTATIALLVAVAGGTTAIAGVAKAPKNSVVAKSIKKGNVTAKKLTTTVRVNAQANITDPSPGDGLYAVGSVAGDSALRAPAQSMAGAAQVAAATVLQSSGPVGGNGWLVGAGTR